jgi:hypothetical protein
MPTQPEVFAEFRTAEEASAVFCHLDFLQKIQDNRTSTVAKRAALLLERLVVDSRREFYKSTLGINKGWRRSRLGGHSGSHFYAWWAPKGAPPLRDLPGFDAKADGAIFLRDIRHHDDHSELNPQSVENYLPVSARDIRAEEYSPSPLTLSQKQFTESRNKVRIIKGYPGSGKTTALWHAADQNSRRSTLYVTFSGDLATLAHTHFERFAPSGKRFHVLTFSRLVRELSGEDEPVAPETKARARFLKEVASLPPRLLGPWLDDRNALYDEIHANMIGAALPVPVGRFAACESPRVPDRIYREQRRRFIGGAAADVVIDLVNTVVRRQPDFQKLFFPELLLAWKALGRLRQPNQAGIASGLLSVDCIAVDEVQDLTPLEAMVIAQLASPTRDRRDEDLTLLLAGDEAQTVRATDFDWGWFHDILHHQVGSPQEFKLDVNLRSPRGIAHLVNAVWELYSTIDKQNRPGDCKEAEIEDEASDQILYCAANPGAELEQLLRTFADREGLAIIALDDKPPGYVPKDLQARILTVSEAKGLDFQAVCILDPGEQLMMFDIDDERVRRDYDVEPLTRRLAIDRLRVAISRPTEHLYFLDVATHRSGRELLTEFIDEAAGEVEIARAIPATVLKTFEEELLDPVERVQLCQKDAIQYMEVKPDIAWARAKQAQALLGPEDQSGSILDNTVRDSVELTVAQVAFTLALRGTRLAEELLGPDLLSEASVSAEVAGRPALADAIYKLKRLRQRYSADAAIALLKDVDAAPEQFEPWFAMELSTHARDILLSLEQSAGDISSYAEVMPMLPAAYKLYGVVDAEERLSNHGRQAIQRLMASGAFAAAMPLIEEDPDSTPELKAQCLEGMGRHAEAAGVFRSQGKLKDALRNYRSIPDVEKALALMREMGGEETNAEALEWIAELKQLLAQRPANLLGATTAAEKEFLTALFEQQLDGTRGKKSPAKPPSKRT